MLGYEHVELEDLLWVVDAFGEEFERWVLMRYMLIGFVVLFEW